MEEILKEAAKQVPSLVVFVVLTIMFLKEIRAGRQQSDAQQAACHVSRKESDAAFSLVVKDNAAAIRENSTALGRTSEICCDLKDSLRPLIADAVRDGIEKAA